MTRHRRTVLLRAGVVAALAAGGLVVAAAPAMAADVTVNLSSNNVDLNPGEAKPLQVQLKNNNNQDKTDVTVNVNAPGGFGGDVVVQTGTTGCTGSGTTAVTCTIAKFAANDQIVLSFTLVAKNPPASVQQGQTKQDTGSVSVPFVGETRNFSVSLHGPNQAPNVPEVSGVIQDGTTAAPIKAAVVVMQDGAGASFQTGSDANGRFRFTSTQDKPIHPGTLSVAAGKDQFQNTTKTFDAKAGQSVTGLRIGLAPVAAATASATAQPTDQATGAATDQPSTTGANPATNKTANSGGTSMLSWVLIGLGAILVLLGIGAIVLLVVRRKDDGDDAEADVDGPPGHGPMPTPASRGIYRTGDAPSAADRTMVAGSEPALARSNAADATTMLRPQQPPPGEYGGGYGATQPQPGYGPTTPGYGAAQPGYAPTQPGYGATQPGYGEPEYPPYGSGGGYRSGGYEPNGYDQRGGHNGYDPNGYDQRGGYGSPPQPQQGGYEQQGGYDQRGGYGYDEPGRHDDRAGYDQDYGRGGYGSQPPAGGYSAPNSGAPNGGPGGYYDEPGGRRPSPQPGRGDQRPPLDWLDD